MAVKGYGQQNIKIFGTLTDSLAHQPISFATVALINQQTKAPVKGIQTDTSGNFVLENVPAGTFTVRISFVGYNDIFKENILVNAATGDLNLGTLPMTASKNNSLKEVVITAKKEALQNIDGKKVFSVDQSLVSKGGNAADLLQNIPTLQIDGNGNVSLRGSTGVKVLVDGKPSVIANGDVTQLLQSIPASTIESIEVIANPSAKYDAEGEGLINIILKKNSRPGFNGLVNLGGGTRDNYNGSANLSYQSGRVNLYGNYNLKNGNTYSNGIQNITFLNPSDSLRYSKETFPSVTRNKIQFLKAGVEYSLTPKSVLGISGSVNLRNTHRNEFLTVDNFAANDYPLQLSNRANTVNNNGKTYELDIDYTQHFKKPKEELTINASYSRGSFRNLQEYQSTVDIVNGHNIASLDTPLISDIQNKATNYNIQADYVLPLGSFGEFSAGYRSQFTIADNNQFAYDVTGAGTSPIYGFTSFFSSNNQVHAVYLNYEGQTGNFSYQAGLRAEDSHLNATFNSYNANNSLFSDPVHVPNEGLYPDILLTEKLGDNSKLQFTFASRVSRPTARELNSATDFSDPVNYERGNPGLTPEKINDLELAYNKTWTNVSFSSSVYYNRIDNVIKHLQIDLDDGVVLTTAENLKQSATAGLELIGHFDLLKGWDLTANTNIFERDNAAAPQFGIAANKSLSWNANVTTNLSIVKRLWLQFHADYRAPEIIIQDRNRSTYGMDAGAKYDLPGNRASLSFNANDVFNTRKWAFLRSSDDILLDFERRTISSRATIAFSYRFGNSSAAPKQARKNEAKADGRIDDGS